MTPLAKTLLETDPTFAAIWQKVQPFTMTSAERGYALYQSVRTLIENDIKGSFVECGVWRGGSSMLVAFTLKELGVCDRNIILVDTYSGMTEASQNDTDLHGHHADELMAGKKGENVAQIVKAEASLDSVRENMRSTGYSEKMIRYVEGDTRTVLPKISTSLIALLRLDTDFYDSTYEELVQLYPRVNKGGVIIIDDYGHWQGAKEAVDQYFSSSKSVKQKPLMWVIDYTGRGMTKLDEPENVGIERYDYVPPDMTDPKLLDLFPNADIINPWLVNWKYMRPVTPHLYRVDNRNKKPFHVGYASYEEAVCLYNLALLMKGKRGLEIGSYFGWTGAHLLAAGLQMDFLDPSFQDDEHRAGVERSFRQIDGARPYKIHASFSPYSIPYIAGHNGEPWSFAFIDGNHDGDAPLKDVTAVKEHCAEDAIIVFHDLTSPHVASGLEVLRAEGWNTTIFNTMQIMGIAWRGDVTMPKYVPDENTPVQTVSHLDGY